MVSVFLYQVVNSKMYSEKLPVSYAILYPPFRRITEKLDKLTANGTAEWKYCLVFYFIFYFKIC